VTAIEVSTAGVTVKMALPVNDPEVAVIVVDPCATLVAKPAVLTVAIVVAEDDHVAVLVRFAVVLLV
jgi:hypothetical protein